jgi:hypothetical protein
LEGQGFLPPEPPGPEPELGERPAPQPPPQTYAYPPPPGYAYPPQQGWAYPQQPVPDNGQAVAGFVFSLVSIGLLVISFGLSTVVSLGCAITGIVCSRNGKKKVDAGETPKHRGLAQAGFIIGWVSLFLSVAATVGWALALAFAIADEGIDVDPEGTSSAVMLLIGG